MRNNYVPAVVRGMPCSINCANTGQCDKSCAPVPTADRPAAESQGSLERFLRTLQLNPPKLPELDNTKDTNPKDAIGIRKAPMSTVPANVMAEVGVAMLEGASKYGRHNYRVAGVRASVYYDAALRHLFSWWEGEDIDPDTVDPETGEGVSHITKAITALVVFRDAQMNGKATDDRPPRVPAFYPRLNKVAAAVLDRNAHLKPKHYTHLNHGEVAA